MTLEIRRLAGDMLAPRLDDLARLRCEVFSEYPYLYDGDMAYEREYLAEYAAEPGSVLIAAIDGDAIVGAATASPMSGQKTEFREPFENRGIDTSRLFYFGESVLQPTFRGQGIGHAFFDHREAAAREASAAACCFAAVIRPDDHPARPPDYRPLDPFWRKRGYAPVEGLITELDWKEHGEAEESPKPMQYWLRKFDD